MKSGILILVLSIGFGIATATAFSASINSRAVDSINVNSSANANVPKKKSPAMASVLEANKKFSNQIFSILAQLAQEDLLYSPIALSTALTTLFVGADQATAREIKRALNYQDIPDSLINHEFSEILGTLQRNENATVKMLNRLFISPEFAISVPYESIVRDQFMGQVLPLDLNNTEEYVSYVNEIVSKFTNGKVERLLTEVDTIPSAKAVLLNTIYLKSDWDRGFTPLLTQKRPFFTVDGDEIEIDMMLRGGDYPFAEIPELNSSVLSIPYKGNRLSFTIILPEREIEIADVEESLKTFPMTSVLGRMSVQYIQLSLPKFKIDSKVDFVKTEVLQNLGIQSMFTAQEATFNKISSVQGLYISSVVQHSHIEVQEGGTEAATANFVEAVPASFRFLTPFTVDRPFIFFIYDRLAESVVFVGKKVR